MNVSRRSFCTTLAAGLAMGMFAGAGAAFAADDKAAELKTVEQGKLIMGTNATFPPYEYYDGDKIVGIDADVAALIADKLGLELEIEDMDFGAIITAVQTGKIDMGLAGITVNDERKKNVSFTDTYASGVQVIIVTEDSPISSPDDLANNADLLIGVQENTTGHIYAADDYGQDRVIPYTSGPTAVQALQAGKVDCVIIDNEPAKNYVEANKGLKILDTAYVEEDYAIAVNKDNTALLDAINGALKELIADGSVKKVIDTYINDGSEDKDFEFEGDSFKYSESMEIKDEDVGDVELMMYYQISDFKGNQAASKFVYFTVKGDNIEVELDDDEEDGESDSEDGGSGSGLQKGTDAAPYTVTGRKIGE